jgi:hypothetical protein
MLNIHHHVIWSRRQLSDQASLAFVPQGAGEETHVWTTGFIGKTYYGLIFPPAVLLLLIYYLFTYYYLLLVVELLS